MTALRGSAVYLAALMAMLGFAFILGAVRALASKGEEGIFLLGLVGGMGLCATGLLIVSASTSLARIETQIGSIAGHLNGEHRPPPAAP